MNSSVEYLKRVCFRKKAISRKKHAKEAARTSSRAFGAPMVAYLCPVCNQYHVGAKRGTKQRIERGDT